jgi:hypothetical protein
LNVNHARYSRLLSLRERIEVRAFLNPIALADSLLPSNRECADGAVQKSDEAEAAAPASGLPRSDLLRAKEFLPSLED